MHKTQLRSYVTTLRCYNSLLSRTLDRSAIEPVQISYRDLCSNVKLESLDKDNFSEKSL